MNSYTRPVTVGGSKYSNSAGSIARLSALRKSFLSPVSEAVSAASGSLSYLTPAEAAYLRTKSVKQAQSSSMSSSGSGSAGSGSMSTSMSLSSSSKSSKTKSSGRISGMTSNTGSYGYEINSMTSSPSRSPPESIVSNSSPQNQTSTPTTSGSSGTTTSSATLSSVSTSGAAAASLAAKKAASIAASVSASVATASAQVTTRTLNSSNKSLKSYQRAASNSKLAPSTSSTNCNLPPPPGAPIGPYMSKIEACILRSSEPIPIHETQEICAAGNKGIWANRCEACQWKGDIPLNDYPINEDSCPEVINKRLKQKLEYVQELAIRYLKPPTPPAPGEIIIKQEPNKTIPPAPPIVIRQQPPRPCTPEPLVIREAPPPAPPCVGRKVITVSGKRLPAPPRKVVIERMPHLPTKPQSVVIERWLPYTEQKRRVIYQKAPPDPVVCKPKNIIVQWEAPEVSVKKDVKHLGIIRANPSEYVQKYGNSLKQPNELPRFVLDIKPQCGVELAANKRFNPVHELEGDVCALKLVNLECEGLSAYKNQLKEKCDRKVCNLCPEPKPISMSMSVTSVPAQMPTSAVLMHRSSPKYAKYSNSSIKFGGVSSMSVNNSIINAVNNTSSLSNNSNRLSPKQVQLQQDNISSSVSLSTNDANNASYGSSFSSNSSSGCGDCEARFSYTISTSEENNSPVCSPVVCSPAKFM